MREYSRTELLELTPDRYLAAGYLDGAGAPRPELHSDFATASCTQLMVAEAAPQEVALTVEALGQLLPLCKGTPGARALDAADQALQTVAGAIRQNSNAGLSLWVRACAARVGSETDLAAFVAHLRAVERLYILMVACLPDAPAIS